MGPKRVTDKEKEPVDGAEQDKMEDELRDLKHQLMIADQQMAEQRMQSDSSRERLNDLLRKQDEQHERRHADMIRIYQDRMTDMCMEKDKVIAEMQEKEQRVMARDAERENWRLERRVRYADQDIESAAQVTPPTYANAPRQSSLVHVCSSLPAHTFEPMGSPRRRYDVDISATPPPVSGIPAMDARNRHYEIPLPRKLVFDGKMSWDSFIKPFQSTALACKWTEQDKLFRLTSSLRGDAAEFVFNQLSPESTHAYGTLTRALESRFKERRTSASYINELESRKFSSREKLLEYAADIKRLVIKGYPTADERSRETISVRCFLKGMSDQQLAVAVGMKDPQTIDDAREMVETYNSLRDDVSRGQKIRMVKFEDSTTNNPGTKTKAINVQQKEEKNCVTISEVEKIVAEKLKQLDAKTPQGAKSPSTLAFQGNNGNRTRGLFSKANVECYRCHKLGHYAHECPRDNVAGNQRGN